MNLLDPDLSATDMARATGLGRAHAVFDVDTATYSVPGATRPAVALDLIRALADTLGTPVPSKQDACEFRLRWYATHPEHGRGMLMVDVGTPGAFPVMLWHPAHAEDRATATVTAAAVALAA